MRFWKLSLAIILATLPALAQNPPASEGETNARPTVPHSLPSSCRDRQRASEQIRILLRTAESHPTAGAYNTLGALFAQSDRVVCAISSFKQALRLDNHDWQAHYNLALAFLRRGDRPSAERELRAAIHEKSDSEAAHFALGTLLEEDRKLAAAAEEFRRVAKMDPNFAPAYTSLADVLFAEGQPALAVSILQEAINHATPENSEQLKAALDKIYARGGGGLAEAQRLNEQANALLGSGKTAAAIDSYRKALALNPKDPLLHYNLSLALGREGDRGGERRELQSSMELDDQLAPAHSQLGLLLLEDHQYFEAEREFKKAIEINPKYAEAKNNLGILYSQQGKDSEAVGFFQKAIESAPRFAKAHVNLGFALARQEAFSEAEKELRTAIEIEPTSVEAYTGLGMLEAKTKRTAEAVETFRKVVQLEPASSEAHLNLGIALVDEYDRPSGLEEFQEALRLDPHSPRVHYNLGHFYFETNKYDQARTELETASQLQPNFADAIYFLALTELHVGNARRATELFEKVVALQPANADAQFLLGQNLEHSGATSEAITHWKMALHADPNQGEALYELARALKRLHDPEAAQYWDRFEELQNKKRVKDQVGQLGNFAIQAAEAQNWPQALEQMKEAMALCGQCEEAAHLHRNLGLMYCRTGNLAEGERELRAALELNPEDADAKKAISLLQSLRGANDKGAGTNKN